MRIQIISIFSFNFLFFFATQLTFADSSSANKDSDVLAKALQQTQGMLTDSTARHEEANKTQAGRAAEQKVDALGGSPATNDDIYALAAEIFGNLFSEANGDPDKMKKILEDAQKNPEAFALRLSSDEKEKLHSIAAKIPSN